MRVAMYYNNNDVKIEEMPTPDINDDEVLTKVIACGICGSDVMEWYRIKRAPLVLGHEIAGEIVKIGKNVDKYKIGDRVVVSHHVPCNTCHYCLHDHHTACETLRITNIYPGGFSEYIRVPKINVDRGVFLLPDEITYYQATFVEPLACVLRSHKIAKIKPAQSVLIIGAGISGLLHVKLARALGAGVIYASDVNVDRLKKAKECGANAAIDAHLDISDELRRIHKKLVDVVIVATGAPSAFTQALKCVDRGGMIVFFASPNPEVETPMKIFDLWKDDITLISSYAASPYEIETIIELLRNKVIKVDDMITDILPLSETKKGFTLVSDAKKSMKVIIEPQK